MKTIIRLTTIALAIIFSKQAAAQDTLHLDFKATQVAPDKAIEDKIVAWGKTLNGKKQDINIVAYYHKGEFKKFAEQRVEEMFLSVNRKVRELVNIKTQEAQKGEDYQRTRVDIIYWAEGSDPKTMAAKKKAEEKAAKEAAEKKKKEDEKLAKDKKDGNSSSTTAKKDDKDKKETKIVPNNKPFVANDEFKSRKLMVVLLSENDKAKEKLAGKPEELEAYKDHIKLHNDNITKAFKNNWKETPVDFITESELAASDLLEKSSNVTVLAPGNKEVEKITFMTYKTYMVYVKGKDLALFEKEFKISINGPAPEVGDYYLLMSKMKVNYKLQSDFNPELQLEEKLKNKTLYVNKDFVELTNEEFKEEYPYPFALKTAEEITEIANSMDKNALYIKTDVAFSPNAINLLLVEAETGNIIARTSQSGLAKVSVNMPSGRFGSSSGFTLGGKQLSFFVCTTCGVAGMELFRLYTAKPKLKRPMISVLKDGKKQKKHFSPTTIN